MATTEVPDFESAETAKITRGSVAHSFESHPLGLPLEAALRAQPGEQTSYDFKAGFYAACAVLQIQVAGVLSQDLDALEEVKPESV